MANAEAGTTKRTGGGRSCVFGSSDKGSCKNKQFPENASLHMFLNIDKEPKRYWQWVCFVRKHRPNNWLSSKNSVICSVHFEDSSFNMRKDIARNLGIKNVVKEGAVPTIDAANDPGEEREISVWERRWVSLIGLCCRSLVYIFIFTISV